MLFYSLNFSSVKRDLTELLKRTTNGTGNEYFLRVLKLCRKIAVLWDYNIKVILLMSVCLGMAVLFAESSYP